MNCYQTHITIEDPNQIILSNLPFQKGQKVEIIISPYQEDKSQVQQELELGERWEKFMTKIQTLSVDNPLTEEEIAAEIEAYRQEK